MKKLIIISAFFLSFISGCFKNVLGISKNDLAGTWLLKNISGGYAGIDSTPTDNISIIFGVNGRYTLTFNYAITATGNYTITKATEPNYYYSKTLLNLISDGNQTTYGINLQEDSLFLSKGCCDQFQYIYVKQK